MAIVSDSERITQRPFDELLEEAVRFHGHCCPGQVLGVRMAVAGCREVGIERPRGAGKRLVVLVEIDRCATDAIQALTGVSLGRRTLKHVDYGKMAATFVDTASGRAVRVAARDDARQAAMLHAPAAPDARSAQITAYGCMAEAHLLDVAPVDVLPGWLDRPRVRVRCAACGEGVSYGREIVRGGRPLCRACAGERYYRCDPGHNGVPIGARSLEADVS
jgi:formylmethanofuran dehydrogenase subunit E